MKNSMSSNDKRLLLIMFLFVVIVGIGYWGVYPQVKNFIKLGSKIENEEIKKSINEQKVSNLIFVEAQCEEFEEKIAENKDRFYDMLSEADIDLMLTGKAISHNLESFNLNILLEDYPSERKAYKYSELYEEQKELEEKNAKAAQSTLETTEDEIAELNNKSSKKNKKSKDDDDEIEVIENEIVDLYGNIDEVGINSDIYAARVTMTLGGERADLEKFLKEIMDSDKEILITSFSWSKYRTQKLKDEFSTLTEGDPEYYSIDSYDIVEMDSLTIAMEIYMCEKEDASESESEEE